MNEKIEKLLKFIKELIDSKKSAQLRINFHEGDVSEKIEIKESVRLNEDKNWKKVSTPLKGRGHKNHNKLFTDKYRLIK